jgi:O-antigen/teichoic acid export membrane protein
MGGAFSAMAGSLLIARMLTPMERGHYASIAVFSMLAVVALEMGGEVGVLRGMTEAEDAGRSFTSGYLGWSLLTSASAGVLTSVVVDWAAQWLQPAWLLSVGVAAVIHASLMSRLVTGVLLFRGKLRLLVLVRTVANSGPILGCAVCACAGLTSAVELAAVSFLFQAVLNSAFMLLLRGRGWLRPGLTVGRWCRDVPRIWQRGNVHLHGMNVSTYATMRADQMALSVMGADVTLGIYAVVVNVAEVAGYLPAALYPLLSRGHPDRRVDLRKTFVVLAVSVVALTPLAFLVIPVLYGGEYRAGQWVALVLVPASGIFAIGRFIQSVELRDPAKRPGLTWISLASAAVEFTVTLFLGRYGGVAAACACAVGYTMYTAWVSLAYKDTLLVPRSSPMTRRHLSRGRGQERSALSGRELLEE